jgi:DNA-directed RNA polymerase subunit RPC12/RpoP
METYINQSETEEIHECASCGQKFEQPIRAELHAGSVTEEYYACPRCLTKVGEVGHERREAIDETEEEAELPVEETVIVEKEKTEETQDCSYYLGYLRKREKGTPIPEGCFTCSKMIECI